MAIVTTYVCDVTGKNGTNQSDFVEITINADNSKIPGMHYSLRQFSVKKLVHIDVARKLNLVHSVSSEVVQPEVTFESKLITLLQDWKDSIVEEATESAIQSVRN